MFILLIFRPFVSLSQLYHSELRFEGCERVAYANICEEELYKHMEHPVQSP